MPRVATTSTSRSQKLADGKVPPNRPLHLRCPESSCLWSFRNQTDLKCHMPRHMSPEEREKQMYKCPQPGCTHQSLQKSNLQTHYNAKHSGLKPHVCKKCSYCAADPSCLHRHMVAVHEYISGTAPRKQRSAACPSPLPALSEPNLSVSSSSDYSDYTTESWSIRGALPSPSSSTYSNFSLSPTSSSSCSDEGLSAFIPSPPPTDFSLPASPNSDDWMWDAHFVAAFFPPTCEKSPTVECTSSPGLALQYPAQGMDFFAVGCDTFLPASFDVEQQQQPLFDNSLDFLPPPPTAPYYGLETFSSCGLKDVVSTSAFVGEWNGALY